MGLSPCVALIFCSQVLASLLALAGDFSFFQGKGSAASPASFAVHKVTCPSGLRERIANP